MTRYTKGTIAATALFTVGAGTFLGLIGIVYASLTGQVEKTADETRVNTVEIAVIKQQVSSIPEMDKKMDLILQNQAFMGSLQGIRLATSTP